MGIFTGRWWHGTRQGDIIKTVDGQMADQRVDSLDWQEVFFEFNSGNNTQVLIQLVKWSDQEATKKANIYIDDVKMVKIGGGGDQGLFDPDEYELVWADEFDGDELDLTDWGYELGSIRGWEQQHYVNNPENVYLEDGKLILQATDRPAEDHYFNPRNPERKVIYNSGSIRTHGKREFLYGRLEIRVKLPKGQGVFPAFWTLGADFTLDGKINPEQGRGWPRTGEIDIMELIGVAQDGHWYNRTVWQTIHYGAGTDSNGKYSGNGTSFTLPSGNFNDDFHVFGIDWSKGVIRWYVDDQIVRVVDYSDDPLAMALFNKPHYIQLNLAMGGAWPEPVADGLAGTKFEIDYVRYYRTPQQEQDAKEWYADTPSLEGVKDITITAGDKVDLLDGLWTEEENEIDFSIDDEYMFSPTGGNTNVKLLVRGKHEMDKVSELPPGEYNIHYSAFPKGVDLNQDLTVKITRKTVKLTVEPKKLDFTELEELIAEAKAISNEDNQYTEESYMALQNAIAAIEKSLGQITTEEELEKAIFDLKKAIESLELEETKLVVSELEELLAKAQSLSNEDGKYTKESFESLQEVIAEVEEVLASVTTEEKLVVILQKLQKALDNLEEVKEDQTEDGTIGETGAGTEDKTDKDHEEKKDGKADEKSDGKVDEKTDNINRNDGKSVDKEGKRLPNTAQPFYTMTLVGFLLLLIGGMFIMRLRIAEK